MADTTYRLGSPTLSLLLSRLVVWLSRFVTEPGLDNWPLLLCYVSDPRDTSYNVLNTVHTLSRVSLLSTQFTPRSDIPSLCNCERSGLCQSARLGLVLVSCRSAHVPMSSART